MLRCPVAVQNATSPETGRLELVRDGAWLFCRDSGYKYPIIDGIPVMLKHVGEKYRDTPVENLPVPPPEPD